MTGLVNYLKIRNMDFTKEEYKQRLTKVKKRMQEKGIELLISHDTNNLNYLTGYDAWSFYYAQCAIVHIDAEEPLCFVRAQDSGGAYIKTYLKDENIIVYDENYIHTWPKHPYDYLLIIIKSGSGVWQRGTSRSRIPSRTLAAREEAPRLYSGHILEALG